MRRKEQNEVPFRRFGFSELNFLETKISQRLRGVNAREVPSASINRRISQKGEGAGETHAVSGNYDHSMVEWS